MFNLCKIRSWRHQVGRKLCSNQNHPPKSWGDRLFYLLSLNGKLSTEMVKLEGPVVLILVLGMYTLHKTFSPPRPKIESAIPIQQEKIQTSPTLPPSIAVRDQGRDGKMKVETPSPEPTKVEVEGTGLRGFFTSSSRSGNSGSQITKEEGLEPRVNMEEYLKKMGKK